MQDHQQIQAQVMWRVLLWLGFKRSPFSSMLLREIHRTWSRTTMNIKRENVSHCRTPVLTSKESVSPSDNTMVAVVFLYRAVIASTILEGIP